MRVCSSILPLQTLISPSCFSWGAPQGHHFRRLLWTAAGEKGWRESTLLMDRICGIQASMRKSRERSLGSHAAPPPFVTNHGLPALPNQQATVYKLLFVASFVILDVIGKLLFVTEADANSFLASPWEGRGHKHEPLQVDPGNSKLWFALYVWTVPGYMNGATFLLSTPYTFGSGKGSCISLKWFQS